jgi:hypothetical protein
VDPHRRDQAARVRPAGVAPLELWDFTVDGKTLFAARHDADFAARLARAVRVWRERHGFGHVWLGGGGVARAELPAELMRVGVPFTISPLGQFAAGPGGLRLAGTPRPLVVDVGQTALKLMWRDGRLRVERDGERPDLRAFISGAIDRARRQAGPIDAVVLALPSEIDDALLPGACSYPGLAGDARLVTDLLARAQLADVPALILNDAELAAVTAQREVPSLPALVLTLGFGVGGALVYNRGMDVETEAREFAVERHAEQRYGERPYVVHLEAVRAVLRDFGHGGALGVAAWLHDVVEDTPTTRDEVEQRFGAEVAALVWAVTGVGDDRKARNAAAYAKIQQLPAAATLKLADRIANVEASATVPAKLERYRAEWQGFATALAGLGDARMWQRLRHGLGVPEQ